MKLLIETEYRENYGDEEKSYWKSKFGSSYVFNNIELDNGKVVGIEEMIAMVEIRNPMAYETVCDWVVLSDNDPLQLESYELPSVIYYTKVDSVWKGYKVCDTRVSRDSCLREGIVLMEEFWDVKPDGSRENYTQKFTMDDDSVHYSQAELAEWYRVVYTQRLYPDVVVRD